MLLTKKKQLFSLKENSVISFVGYANFLRINLETLNNINWFVDGITLSKVFSLLKINVEKNSFDFTGVAHDIFIWCIKNNYQIHFIGGTINDAKIFKIKIKNKYPKLRISVQDGYDSIKKFNYNSLENVDVCVYGLGSPLQEIISIKNKYLFKYSFTCGAFITQTASAKDNYYTPLIIKFNLRWLYRIYKEKGHFKRLFYAFLKIPSIYIKSKKIINSNNYI